MNIRKLLLGSIAVMVSAFALTSCDSDDTYYYYVPYQANAIVTVKTAENGDWYMQLDDSTTLYATNIHQAPYNKEVRALVSCYETGGDANGYSKAVFVNQIDSFLTKPAVTSPTGDIDKIYGNDPIEIVKSWMTVAEDGYLTLRVRTLWGANGKPHYINLLTGLNRTTPERLWGHTGTLGRCTRSIQTEQPAPLRQDYHHGEISVVQRREES